MILDPETLRSGTTIL